MASSVPGAAGRITTRCQAGETTPTVFLEEEPFQADEVHDSEVSAFQRQFADLIRKQAEIHDMLKSLLASQHQTQKPDQETGQQNRNLDGELYCREGGRIVGALGNDTDPRIEKNPLSLSSSSSERRNPRSTRCCQWRYPVLDPIHGDCVFSRLGEYNGQEEIMYLTTLRSALTR